MSSDICIIIKGCVFDWCLSNQESGLEAAVKRILTQFLAIYKN
ncbi:hypothetical protein HSISB1_1528 [Streptococcus sp. HSISB1]|nr:hypothetical protein HSISB1_1528 [Streptococcus sp. HSISB1]